MNRVLGVTGIAYFVAQYTLYMCFRACGFCCTYRVRVVLSAVFCLSFPRSPQQQCNERQQHLLLITLALCLRLPDRLCVVEMGQSLPI